VREDNVLVGMELAPRFCYNSVHSQFTHWDQEVR